MQLEIVIRSDVFETGGEEWLPENLQQEVAASERDRWPEEPARGAQPGDVQDWSGRRGLRSQFRQSRAQSSRSARVRAQLQVKLRWTTVLSRRSSMARRR